jgi:hypothetical protein
MPNTLLFFTSPADFNNKEVNYGVELALHSQLSALEKATVLILVPENLYNFNA